jgi:serine/threonine protein kinase
MEVGNYTGLQADLFATGVILFIIYSATPPFRSTKNSDSMYRLIREKKFNKFWAIHEKKKPESFFSESFKKLINSFFSADISQRPTFESLKVNEWLNGDEALQSDIEI